MAVHLVRSPNPVAMAHAVAVTLAEPPNSSWNLCLCGRKESSFPLFWVSWSDGLIAFGVTVGWGGRWLGFLGGLSWCGDWLTVTWTFDGTKFQSRPTGLVRRGCYVRCDSTAVVSLLSRLVLPYTSLFAWWACRLRPRISLQLWVLEFCILSSERARLVWVQGVRLSLAPGWVLVLECCEICE